MSRQIDGQLLLGKSLYVHVLILETKWDMPGVCDPCWVNSPGSKKTVPSPRQWLLNGLFDGHERAVATILWVVVSMTSANGHGPRIPGHHIT